MTITDLKKYAEQMNAQLSPNDRLQITLRRDAMTYIGAFLQDRHESIVKALNDPKIRPTKRANRQLEKDMLEAAIDALNNARMLL